MKRGSSSLPAISRARADGSTSASSTSRPSTFETAFCATQSTSPSSSGTPWRSNAPASRLARSSPRAQLAQPVDADDAQRGHPSTAAIAASASRRLVARSCIRDGATTARRPSASTSGTRAASASSSTNADASGASSRATPERPRRGPERLEHARERPLDRLPRDDRRDRHDPLAPRDERIAHAVDGQDRVERDERVRRRQHDRVRLADRVEHAGRRSGGKARRSGRCARGSTARRPTSHCWNSSSPASVPMQRAQPVVGRRQQPDRESEPPGEVGGDRRQRLAGAQALAAHEVEADVAVAEDEPVGAPELGGDRPAPRGCRPRRPTR